MSIQHCSLCPPVDDELPSFRNVRKNSQAERRDQSKCLADLEGGCNSQAQQTTRLQSFAAEYPLLGFLARFT